MLHQAMSMLSALALGTAELNASDLFPAALHWCHARQSLDRVINSHKV